MTWRQRWKQTTIGNQLLIVATVVIAGANLSYVILAFLQLLEMRSSSADTRALANAAGKQADRTKDLADRMKDQADRTKTMADQAILQAQAAQSTAETASKAFTVANRPWIKISHRILSPLTFDVGGRVGNPVAMMTFEDTLENVGPTVAVNVINWEDVIPVDKDYRMETARSRQKEWCDANRHQQGTLTGYMLFPHDPSVGASTVGPTMIKVRESTRRDGKVAFVLVGCVCYKAPYESKTAPTHQTRFIYWLGVPTSEGGFNPYLVPAGIANTLRLISMDLGFTAD